MVNGNERGAGWPSVASRLTPPGCLPRATFLAVEAVWPMAYGEEICGTFIFVAPRCPPAERLVEEIGGRLITLAEVPHQKQAQFLEEVRNALSIWAWDVFNVNDNRLFEKGDRLLRQIFGSADALHKQLSELVDAHETGAGLDSPLFDTPLAYVCRRLEDALWPTKNEQRMDVADILSFVSSLLRAIERALEDRRTAGLEALVFKLARAAYRADGKFTAHRKVGRKGSLIRALNEIKDCLPSVDNEDGAKLADTLPAPDQHPVATYERLLSRARPSRRTRSPSAG